MHLLIDLENIQPAPADVAAFIGAAGRAWIFHGPHQQRKLPALAALGERVTLVPISRTGSNALDFHLMFYLGHLACRYPGQDFVVLSRDAGFDPAIEHARMMMFAMRRVDSLHADAIAEGASAAPLRAKAPAKRARPARKSPAAKRAPAPNSALAAKAGPPAAKEAKAKPAQPAKAVPAPMAAKKPKERTVDAVYQDALRAVRSSKRPARLAKLEHWVQAAFGLEPVPEKVHAVLDLLFAAGVIRVDNGKLTYPAA